MLGYERPSYIKNLPPGQVKSQVPTYPDLVKGASMADFYGRWPLTFIYDVEQLTLKLLHIYKYLTVYETSIS